MSPIIYILYNANASALGKVDYAFRKLTSSANNSPCSACDLTHGGLRLTETKDWAATKKRIPAEVWQLHRDEASQEVCCGRYTSAAVEDRVTWICELMEAVACRFWTL